MQGISIFQAFALILTGALNPGALAVSAVFLGRDRGAHLENAFLIGGLIMSLVVGGVVVVLVRTTGLELPKNTTPRYDVRLGVGIILLVLALFLPRLLNLRHKKEEGKPSRVDRLMKTGGIGGAVLVGAVTFAPTAQYLGGTQAIATASRPVLLVIVLIVAAAIVNVSLVWIILITFLRHPEGAQSHLARLTAWVEKNGPTVIRGLLVVVGAVLVISSIIGLT